jgi:hypothetical protein
MIKKKKQWEPLVFRPELPAGWGAIEQNGGVRAESTSYIRWGLDHHNGEPRRFWVVFNEFNPEHWENRDLEYKYTVRGGNDIKPGTQLRYFNKLKDAENYMVYLMESTDRWIAEITSPAYIDAYNKRIEALKKRMEKNPEEF